MPFGVPIVVGWSWDIKFRKDIKHGFLNAEGFVGRSSGLNKEVRQPLPMDMVGMWNNRIDLSDRDLEHGFNEHQFRWIDWMLIHNKNN